MPLDLEHRLNEEVLSGRHASIEEAILERISHHDDPELLLSGMDVQALRRDLNDAWSCRDDAVDGETVFARLAGKSDSLRSQGK